jgi:hypothetical protein
VGYVEAKASPFWVVLEYLHFLLMTSGVFAVWFFRLCEDLHGTTNGGPGRDGSASEVNQPIKWLSQ